PDHGVVVHAHVLGEDDHRHRGGDALVAAARGDDDRQLAAAHSGVGPGGGHGAGPGGHIAAVVLQQHRADVCAPVAPDDLFGDGIVVVDLPFDHFPDVVHVHGLDKLQNALHRHKAPVGHGLGGGLRAAVAGFQQYLAVFLNVDDVGMEIRDAQFDVVLSGPEGENDVEDDVAFSRADFDLMVRHKGPNGLLLLLGHLGD